MSSNPKIYINTAYCGEEGFDDCVQSINNQMDVDITHHVVKDLPILDAFNEMYQSWEKVRSIYDYAIQLDADMRFKTETSLIEMIKSIPNNYNHWLFPVYDWPTMSNIWGFHIYGPDLNWPELKNKYGPDKEQSLNPNHKFWSTNQNSSAYIMHAEKFNMNQAFHLGWHRHIRQHKAYINNVGLINKRAPHIYRKWILDGAAAARRCLSENSDNKSNIEYTAALYLEEFKKYERMQNE